MRRYHFSIQFEDFEMSHHGTFTSASKMVAGVKADADEALQKKLKVWNMTKEKIIRYEIYTFIDGKEVLIFKFKI